MSLPNFIDCEASSLSGKSYPIEIAWNNSNGDVESCLINPLSVLHWTDWSESAQMLHGLSREYLAEHGETPEHVTLKMNEALSGLTVYSDCPEYDGLWIRALFSVADLDMSFSIRDANALFNKVNPSYRDYQTNARRVAGAVHRADSDVAYLVALYRFCLLPP